MNDERGMKGKQFSVHRSAFIVHRFLTIYVLKHPDAA